MWPTGDARHVSTKQHPDGESWVLTYAVDVIPASDAADGAQTPRVTGKAGDTAAEQDDTVLATGATNYAPPAETVDDGDETTES
jgi:pyruvate/2-oxoglutarate dehydrogenase complex dihydrolipoamide dehydrogenase (E3) component